MVAVVVGGRGGEEGEGGAHPEVEGGEEELRMAGEGDRTERVLPPLWHRGTVLTGAGRLAAGVEEGEGLEDGIGSSWHPEVVLWEADTLWSAHPYLPLLLTPSSGDGDFL